MKIARRLRKILLSGLLCGLTVAGCASLPNDKSSAFVRVRRSFVSGGKTILVDVYTPSSGGLHPPVLVLHGAGGMLFDGPEMSRVARALASADFTVYQVHYFDRTNTWFARQAVLLKLFPTWGGTVHDAVEWVRSVSARGQSIGIFGYSLGVFAAIEEARRNPTIGAVAEEAGGFWQGHPEGPTRQPLPPILVIHGTADTRVPEAKYTEPLIAYLRAHDDLFEKSFYPGEGHVFSAA
ncbi:MAG TPA: dienelactone hydrolase family protein, partial [Chthoniobacterales bacterium]